MLCYICLCGEEEGALLESCCACTHLVHDKCLQRWRDAKEDTDVCEICQQPYEVRMEEPPRPQQDVDRSTHLIINCLNFVFILILVYLVVHVSLQIDGALVLGPLLLFFVVVCIFKLCFLFCNSLYVARWRTAINVRHF